MIQDEYMLWNPIVDYCGESKSEMNRITTKRLQMLVDTYDELEGAKKEYQLRINELMKKAGSAEEIYKIATEDNFKRCMNIDYTFSFFGTLTQIAYMESTYMKTSVLEHAADMVEMCEYAQRLIFGLRRLEYDWEEEAVTPFLEWIVNEQISYVVLAELIAQPLFVDKVLICKRLLQFFLKNDNKMLGLKLFFMAAKRHNTEYYYLELAVVLINEGELLPAYELLKGMEHKSEQVTEVLELLKMRLQINE